MVNQIMKLNKLSPAFSTGDFYYPEVTPGVSYSFIVIGAGSIVGFSSDLDADLYADSGHTYYTDYNSGHGDDPLIFDASSIADTFFEIYVFYNHLGNDPYQLLYTDKTVVLSMDNDSSIGTPLDETFIGSTGTNFIEGGSGNDLIFGFDGGDILTDDEAAGIDRMYGGNGSDLLYVSAPQAGEVFDGGADYDSLYLYNMTSGITANFSSDRFRVNGALFTNIEVLIGTTHDDVIRSATVGDRIDADYGNDVVFGGLDDNLSGNRGNDKIFIDGLPDVVSGGDGTDTLIVTQSITFGASSISEFERILAEGNIVLDLSAVSEGGQSVISRSTAGESTTILGTIFADRLQAGAGTDTLVGGAGNDVLLDGSGNTTFSYGGAGGGRDTISGFDQGTDKIFIQNFVPFEDLSIREQGTRSVIDFGNGDYLFVNGVFGLTADDFLFPD